MTVRKVTLSRTELYEKIWTEPMSKLAPRYGLSDVGLAKICKRNKIPRPPRGYWAKKQFGNAPCRTPLPNKDHDPVIEINGYPFQTRHPKIEEPIIGQVALEKKHDRKIIVPEQMASPHPLVIKTAEILNSAKPDRTGKLKSPWGKCLDIEATPRDLPRALLIMDTLIKALEERGYEIPPITGQTRVKIQGVLVGFQLRSQLIRTRLEPRELSLEGYYQFGYNRIESRPDLPGLLRLEIICGCRGNGQARRSWGDTPSLRLEDLLNQFIIGLLRAAASATEVGQGQPVKQRDDDESSQPAPETGSEL
jgi:hypothetical protein